MFIANVILLLVWVKYLMNYTLYGLINC